tara:strand:- start:1494 stop:2456 length:963 start_codon:yes stop_codon:yes gene_type:complete
MVKRARKDKGGVDKSIPEPVDEEKNKAHLPSDDDDGDGDQTEEHVDLSGTPFPHTIDPKQRQKISRENKLARMVGYRKIAKKAGLYNNAIVSNVISIEAVRRMAKYMPQHTSKPSYAIDEYKTILDSGFEPCPPGAAAVLVHHLEMFSRKRDEDAVLRAFEGNTKTIQARHLHSVIRSMLPVLEAEVSTALPIGLVRNCQTIDTKFNKIGTTYERKVDESGNPYGSHKISKDSKDNSNDDIINVGTLPVLLRASMWDAKRIDADKEETTTRKEFANEKKRRAYEEQEIAKKNRVKNKNTTDESPTINGMHDVPSDVLASA